MLRPSRLQCAAVAATLAIACVFATAAFAGKGGGGGGSYVPTLDVVWPYVGANTVPSPTPVPYVLSGCGYNASFGGVTVVVTSPQSASFAGQIPNSDGCITLTNWSTQGAGDYTVKAYQTTKNRTFVVAATSFTVS